MSAQTAAGEAALVCAAMLSQNKPAGALRCTCCSRPRRQLHSQAVVHLGQRQSDKAVTLALQPGRCLCTAAAHVTCHKPKDKHDMLHQPAALSTACAARAVPRCAVL